MTSFVSHLPAPFRHHIVALRMLVVMTVVTGIAYPLVIVALAQSAFADRANGSLVHMGGRAVGSRLLGQAFTDANGKPLAQWFQARPSAGNYDPLNSGATNLGPDNAALVQAIEQRRAAIAAFDGVPAASVPPDALTTSGSGLDPDISPAYAYEQVNRVAAARRLTPATVHALVRAHVRGRTLGFLGEPRVNVVELNVALAKLSA
jgi:K+-transporting ATPase ATPase C chain